jgi:membrane-associated phospholipid phosphatase
MVLLALAAVACTDGPDRALRPDAPNLSAVKFWEAGATTTWNERAAELITLRPPANSQAAVVRILAYLSIAQYRAVLAAEEGRSGPSHPSVPAAVGGASVAVLSHFFPLDVTQIEAWLAVDLTAELWPGSTHQDASVGEAIGRAEGTQVLAQVATDNYLVLSPGTPPVGQGFWVSNGAPARILLGVRPFFMTSADQLRSPPPPGFGSPGFLAALAEIRAISDTRTAEQLASAQLWNTNSGSFTAGALNQIAVELIRGHHRTEREAARILAYANAAVFDALIACSDAKYFYWYIRPSQADPAITLPIGLPNHPSYPSGHSCLTGAMMTILIDAFPSERDRLEGIIMAAGLSRMYAGIHYRFDVEAGQAIGRGAAALALAGRLE